MKTAQDPRHRRRRETVQALYSASLARRLPRRVKAGESRRAGFGQTRPKTELAQKVEKVLKKVDKIIAGAAPQWPIERINAVDLAILRLAVYELVLAKKEPPKVVIDEAVELAKEFGSENSPGFINGALGNILKKS